MSDSIDAVFTWVNGSDPEWIQKKEKYLKEESLSLKDKESNSNIRYIESNEIFYSIHLLRKNAPWIRTIYLVVDQQIPGWLTKRKISELNIVIVDHTEIFKGYERFLPTFNSRSIETMLFKIPNISDRFIYFNDDVLVVEPVLPSDFFIGNDLVVRGRLRFKNRILDKLYKKISGMTRRAKLNKGGYVGRLPVSTSLPGGNTYIELAHAAHGIFKKDFCEFIDDKFINENSVYRFRVKKQLSPFSYILNWSKINRNVIREDSDWKCVYLDDMLSSDGDFIFSFDDFERFKFICFNDLSGLSDSDLLKLHILLDDKLCL